MPDCDLNNEFKRRQELHRELDKMILTYTDIRYNKSLET